MSHFYASIHGNRGEVTRQGTAQSGIVGHIRGWNIGIRVSMHEADGKDVATVYLTGGSNGNRPDRLIGRFAEDGK